MMKSLHKQGCWLLFAAALATHISNVEAQSTPPTILSQPVGAAKVTGSAYTLNVTATSSNLSYQRYQNGSPASESNSTSAHLALSSLTTNDAGSYTVVVTNDGGSITSSVAVLIVQDLPVVTNLSGITTNIIAVGQNVDMTVECSGEGLGFVWTKSGTVLPGATSSNAYESTYPIVGVTAGNAGNYACTITNAVGSATNTFDLITVAAPVVTTQPAGKGLALGSNYTMTVAATGTYLSYYWFNGTNQVGTNGPSYTITGATTNDAGTYSVLVSNIAGTVTSSNAVVTVQALPVITVQPLATNIAATNTTLTLTVTATGDGLDYQWFKGTAAISGATSSNLVFNNLVTTNAGTYSVVVSNFAAKATSANAIVIPVVAPSITTQPVGKGLALGSNYTMTVAATSTYLSYYWFNGTNQVGTNGPSYTITAATTNDAGTYSVVVSNIASTVTSSNAVVTVQALPVITVQPLATNIAATNTTLTLTVTATGGGLDYQWFKGAAAISGATSSNLVFNSLVTTNAGTYSVVVSNFAAKANSANAVVIPVVAPIITTQPVGKGLALGSNYTMTVAASSTYLNYYWFNGTNQVGTNGPSYTITGATTNDAGTYSVLVSNIADTVTSSNAVVTVQALPVITVQPLATNIAATNTALTLTVTATGDGLDYQWFKGTAAISGATSSNLVFNNLVTTNAGTYSVVVSNFAAKATSSNAVVIPVITPGITTQPVGKGLALGSNYTLSVATSGSYLTYYWLKGTNQVGTNGPSYTITAATTNDAGTYSVLVSNIASTVTSSNAVVTVQALPVITVQPLATNIAATNTTLTLTVTATGDGLDYQWFKGAAAISGATSSNLVFNNLVTTNAGTYSVVVSNFAAKATSSNAVVIPVIAPSITTQPVGKGLALGSNYTLSVAASGSYLTYYWLKGTNQVGTNGPSYTITAATTNDAGTYSVLVSNIASTVTSSNAVVTVQALPVITVQPLATNIAATNTTLTLTVTATGDGLDYQWFKGTAAISGAASSNLVFNSLVTTNAGTYSVVISNYAAKVTSSNAVVIPVVAPIFTNQPVGKGLALGSNYTLSVGASGSYLTYYWFKGTNQVGTNNNRYSITAATTNDAGTYSVLVSNIAGTVTSSNAVVTVQALPVITVQPLATNIAATNTTLTLTVTATGGGLDYQWFKGAAAISGATSSNLVFSTLVTSNAGTYSVAVSNFAAKATSSNAVVIPVVAPGITTQPVGKGLALGSNCTLSVAASGSYLTYYWLKGTNQVGTNGPSYTITAAATNDAGTYSVLVSNIASTVTSSNAVVTVQALPVITVQPLATNIAATNTALTLTVTATGGGLDYQWFKGAAAISGATSSNLVFNSLVTTNAGTYSVVVSNFAAKATSSNAIVIPVVAPSITTQPVGKGLALGSNYTLSVAASGSYLTYYWLKGTNQVGTNGPGYTITGATTNDAGTYSVLVSNIACTVTSSNAVVTVQTPPTITVQPLATNIAATNTTLTLTVTATGSGLDYQWFKGTAAISGATSSNLVFNNLVTSNAGTYSVVVSNFAAKATSANAVVIPVVAPIFTNQPVGKGLALGSNYTLSVGASGSYLTYYWFKGTNQVGTNNNRYSITAATTNDAGTYSVLVSNIAGTVTSSNAVVTVQALPVITVQPLATNIAATNTTLTLTVTATGGGLDYQWFKGAAAISGATSSNLVFNSLVTSNAGTYSVAVSNFAAKATSANAIVIPVVAPSITTQPVGKGLALGSNYTLSVAASGSYLTYYWLKGTNQVGTNGPGYTITGATTNDAGTYSVLVSNIACTVTSSNAVVTVQTPPTITVQPLATNIAATNTTLTLTVTATGSGLDYQWFKGTAAISGATSSNLVFNNLVASNAGTYSVVVINFAAKATSSNAVVIPVVAPIFTNQPVGKGLALGSNYTLSVGASGSYLTYYWFKGTNQVGTNNNRYSITAATTNDAGTYSVLVSNIAGTVTSSNAVVTVQAPPAIVVQPASSSNQLGGTIYIYTVASGDGLNFRWTKSAAAATNGSATSYFITNASQYPSNLVVTNTGVYFSLLTISNCKMSDAGSYTVTTSNFVTSVTSSNATVVVVAPPALTVAATNVSILESASGALKVTATGTGPIAFQWATGVSNTPIAGATNATYTITNMTSAAAGAYELTASNFGGATVTNIHVTYLADTNPPVVTLVGAGATFTNAALSVTGTATDNVATSNVVFSLNGGITFSNATSTNAWTNFTISGTMTNVGTNTLIVKAIDVNGNWSTPLTNHPVYAPYYTVTVSTSGSGTVSSNWSHAGVQWGTTYTATALPGANFVLSNWTGSIPTNVATIKFSPTSNMTLMANFSTNLFIGYQGVYNGLFSGSTGGTNLETSGGYLTMTINTNQTYTGKIYVSGSSAALSGAFNINGSLTATASITNGPTLNLSLSLDFTNVELTGTISNANWTSTNLEADLAQFSSLNPTTNVGTYTFVIPTQSGQGLGQGYGSGTMIVSSNGAITFVGVAADNTSLSQSTTLSKDGYWPLYTAIYPNTGKIDQGLVMGWLQFSNGLPAGAVTWVSTNGGLTASSSNIESSVFVKPAPGVNRVVTNQLATITFNGAGLTSSFSEILAISDKGTVASDGAASVTFSLSGLISGTMVDPTSNATNKIYGIILQHDSTCLGKGTIAGPTLGNFVITPYP